MAAQKPGQAEFVRWMGPLLDALRALGGSAKPRECSDWIAEQFKLSDTQREARTSSGGERFHNQVQWARQYLVWEGLLDTAKRGVWTLTPKGNQLRLTPESSRELFLKWVAIHAKNRQHKIGTQPSTKEAAEEDKVPEEMEEEALLAVLQSLPASGFERLCKRLLHEYGFEKLVVTGRSRDQGIDGIGVLRLNAFVVLKVLFQCKRYKGSVGRAEVGEFRNAMLGRADKGIFITTGYFTSEAEKEANREGVPPIELVDGERLVELFQQKLLGLRRREVFEVDHSFFDQFRQAE